MARRAPLGLIAAAAMLGSHWVAYLLAAPDPHARAELLLSTGHGYWPVAVTLAIAAGVCGLVSFVSHRLSTNVCSSRRQIFAYSFPRFFVLQVGGFAVMEFAERLASGHGLAVSGLLAATFLIGVAIQALVSVLSALLLVLIAFVVERLAVRSSAVGSTSAPQPLVSLISTPRLVPATGGHTLRGPPLRA
jgi:hypothetical protein